MNKNFTKVCAKVLMSTALISSVGLIGTNILSYKHNNLTAAKQELANKEKLKNTYVGTSSRFNNKFSYEGKIGDEIRIGAVQLPGYKSGQDNTNFIKDFKLVNIDIKFTLYSKWGLESNFVRNWSRDISQQPKEFPEWEDAIKNRFGLILRSWWNWEGKTNSKGISMIATEVNDKVEEWNSTEIAKVTFNNPIFGASQYFDVEVKITTEVPYS